MYIGIILAGIFAAGLVKNPWPLAIALAAIPVAWYWNKHGSPLTALMSWWRKSPATPTTSSPPTKKKWSKYVPWKTALILLVIALFFFQYPRDIILSWIRNPAITNSITGTETVRSVTVSRLEGTDVCDLKPNTSYHFTGARVGSPDKVTYQIRNKRDGEIVSARITGMVTQDASKHPYRDPNYDFGILLNGVPPGRQVETNSAGCLQISFNTPLAPFFNMDPTGIGIHLRN